MKTKAFIVDDHPFARAGVRSILERNSAIDIIGEAIDGTDAIKQVIDKQPNLVVMDISMPHLSGIDTTKEILHKLPDVKIIGLSIHSGQKYVKGMLDAGAVGYLLKDEAPEELLIAIEKVDKGDIYLSSGVTRVALSEAKHSEDLTTKSILQSKLQRPPISFDYVVRTKIIHELESNIIKPLSMVSAGAGYGKSIMVSQWLEHTKYLYSWISLDEEHNDFRKFLYYLIASIEKVLPGLLENTKELAFATNLPPDKEFFNTLINELCDIDQDLILVLDDYYLIKEKKIHNLLNGWLRFPPSRVHICIITRRDPPLNIKSLAVSGRMTEIRMDKLSFTNEEIAEFFEQRNHVELNDKSLQILQNKTEGWVMGLQLVSMILKNKEELNQTLQSLEGGVHSLTEYLLAEVLSIQPEHIQAQLLATSVLDRFCAELIDVIIEPKGEKYLAGKGTDLLQWLIKSNLFVIRLDLEQKWFRYHHMFQDFLDGELKKRISPQQVEEINMKASNWFERQNLLEEAMHYALAISEHERAIEIIKAHRVHLLSTGQWQLLKHLHQSLPKSIIEKDPELLLIAAYLSFYLADHKNVGAVLKMLEPLVNDFDKDSLLFGEYHFFLGYATIYLKGDKVNCVKSMEIALKEIPESAAEPRALVELFYPIFLQISAHYSKAIKWLEETVSKFEDYSPIRKNRLLLSILMSSTAEANLNLVENYHLRALNLARESKIADSHGICLMMSGHLLMRRGNWQSAIPHYEEMLDLKYNVHVRTVIDCLTSLAIISGMHGNHNKGIEHIKTLKNFIENLGDYHKRFLWSCEIRYQILQNDVEIIRELLSQYRPDFVHLVLWIDVPEITYARALIFEGSEENLSLAAKELNKLDLMTTSQNNKVHQLEIYALQAILYDKQGELDKAKEKLVKSIELAEPGRIIGYYVELGEPIAHLISKMPDEFKNKAIIKKILELAKITNATLVAGSRKKVTGLLSLEEPLDALTHSELKVLQYIAEGLRNQEIADKLCNSEETIKKHIYHMFQKMHVKNRLSLVSKAKELEILV